MENHLDNLEAKWFAVYTSHRREKIATRYLTNQGIQTYLPIQKHTRKYVRKIKVVELPLISHYTFVKITKSEYIKVLECPYVVRFVKIAQNLLSIPEEEIILLQRILGEFPDVDVDQSTFREGDFVEVIGGNLTGLKGILIKKENNQFFSVALDNIGLVLNISIAPKLLRKISREKV